MTKTFAPLSFLVACFFALCLAMTSSPVQAHAFDATDGLVHFSSDNKTFLVRLDMNLEAILAGVDPAVKDTSESPQAKEYDRLRRLPPDQLEAEFAEFKEKLLSGMTFLVDGAPVTTKLDELKFREVGDLTKPRKTFLQEPRHSLSAGNPSSGRFCSEPSPPIRARCTSKLSKAGI